jgi:hypothetical protein
MLRKFHLLVLAIFCLGEVVFAQERKTIHINQFTYLYTGHGLPETKPEGWQTVGARVIYALNDSIRQIMGKMAVDAINAYWEAGIDSAQFQLEKANPMFREYPKFKPKIPKKYSDGWELFFRIVDKGNPLIMFTGFEQPNNYAGTFLLECKVLNGNDGSEIFSKTMDAVVEFGFKPQGCYVLKNIPGLTADYLDAFSEILSRFFSSNTPSLYTASIKPACLFIDLKTATQIKRTIRFERSGNTLQVVEGPDLGWTPKSTEKEKAGKTKVQGNGIGSGLLALAGVDNSKERVEKTKFIHRINMEDKSTGILYVFHFPVEEIVTQEVQTNSVKKEGNSTFEKQVGPGQIDRRMDGPAHIVRGNDTIGKFELRRAFPANKDDNLNRMWNGKDSSTITPIPEHWGTSGTYQPLQLKGTLYGKEFLFTNSKGGNQLDVWYGNQHVATFKLEDYLPEEGILYNTDIEEEVLKVLGMLASLPYESYL